MLSYFLRPLVSLFILIILSISFSSLTACRNNYELYSSINAYKDDIKGKIGIAYEKLIDINDDGQVDHLIFLTSGEELYANILISTRGNFVRLNLPHGEEYEIYISPEGRHILRIGHTTFPQFGDVHSSDCYNFSEFFKIRGRRIEDVSRSYADYYERMINIYQTRKLELEKEANTIDKDDMFRQLIIDQANKYEGFITRAQGLIKEKCAGYAKMSRGPATLPALINEHFPGYMILDTGDLSAKVKSYYENHVMNFEPFLISRDFDGNGQNDLAMLLKSQIGGNKKKAFAVLLQFGNSQYETAYCRTLENHQDDLFLIPIASWKALGRDAFFRNPAVGMCSYKDGSGIVAVWNELKKEFDEITTTDLLCH